MWLTLILLISASNPNAASFISRGYKPIQMASTTWSKMIAKSVSRDVLSMIECASSCLIDKQKHGVCDTFVHDSPRCYLGQFNGTYSVIPDPGHDTTAHVAEDLLEPNVNFLSISDLQDSAIFRPRIYKSEHATIPEECLTNCLIVETICDFYIFDVNTCHYGNVSHNATEPAVLNSTSGWTLYHKTSTMATTLATLLPNFMNSRASKWCPYVYKVIEVSQPDECYGFCAFESNANCHFSALKNNLCYLGNYNHSNIGLTCPEGNTLVTLKFGDYNSTSYFSTKVVTETSFSYETYIIANRTWRKSESECMVSCLVNWAPYCHFFFFTDSCYLGSFVAMNSPNTSFTTSPQSVLIMKDQLEIDSRVGLTIKVSTQVFNSYSFSAEVIETMELCVSSCLLMTDGLQPPCNMVSYDVTTQNCSRASYDLSNGTTALNSSSAETTSVFVLNETLNEWLAQFSINTQWESSQLQSFLYKRINMNNVLENSTIMSCSAYCTLDQDGCSFFVVEAPYCYLGDWNVQTDLFTITSTSVYSKPPELVVNTTLALAITLSTREFNSYTFATETHATMEMCVSSCHQLLNDSLQPPCHMVTYDFISQTCWKASHDFDNSTTAAISSNFQTTSVLVPVETLHDWLDDFSINTQLNSTFLYNRINVGYESHNLTVLACSAYCTLDQDVCNIFVVEVPYCYLGDWNVQASLFTITTTTAYSKRPQAALVHGGYGETMNETYADFDHVFGEKGHVCPNEGFLPPLSIGLSNHAMVYKHPWLVVCGGEDSASNVQNSCYKMNFISGQRTWEIMEPMKNPLRRFVLLPYGDFLYLFNGEEKTSWFSDEIWEYSFASNSWKRVDLLPSRSSMCGVVVNNDIWIMGGQRPDDTTLQDAIIFNPPFTFSGTDFLPDDFTAHMVCDVITDEQTGHQWIIAAGGYNSTGGRTTDLRYYDVTNSSGWSVIPDAMPHSIGETYTSHGMFKFTPTELAIFSPRLDNSYTLDTVQYYNFATRTFEAKTFGKPIRDRIRRWAAASMVPADLLWTCQSMSIEWKLLVNHDAANSTFFNLPNDTIVHNELDETSPTYMNLAVLDDYKSCDGRYHLRLVYPDLGYYNEWYQTSSPLSSTIPPEGFQAIAVKYSGFIGLYRHSSNVTLMAGSDDLNLWFFAVGQSTDWNGTEALIAGPVNYENLEKVKLFIKKDC